MEKKLNECGWKNNLKQQNYFENKKLWTPRSEVFMKKIWIMILFAEYLGENTKEQSCFFLSKWVEE